MRPGRGRPAATCRPAEPVIGIFGGSFDPVHHGHLIVARAAREQLGLAEVRFVPAGRQPLKQGHAAGPADRLAMLEAAVAGEPGFAVDPLELERPGPSYTVETLAALAERHPGVPLVLLLGADAAADFAKWRDPAGIRALARVVVLTRDGARGAGPADLEVVRVPAVEISATAIRARVRAGQSIRWLVPDGVAALIAARGLYLTQDDVGR